MYIWLGIDVNEQLNTLREKTTKVTQMLNSLNSALTLPLHISLRISFPVDDAISGDVINRIREYYLTLSPFAVTVQGIEKNGNVVWIKMAENDVLKKIHKDLVDILLKEFGVQPHDFDSSFIFHATLFMDNDGSKVDEAYSILQQEILPEKLMADKLVIGCSETGRAGEYRVVKEFEL